MKTLLVLVALLLLLAPLTRASAQTITTKIAWFEINEKEARNDYRVFLYAHGTEFEAKRTPDGFVVPDELRNERTLDVRIVMEKYKLVFNSIHISSFAEEWRIGIRTKKPFAEEFDITGNESKTIRFIYYLDVDAGRNIYMIFKNSEASAKFIASREQK